MSELGSAPCEVTVFDLDGVLTRRDTMASVVKDFLLERPTRLIEALPLASIAAIAGPRSLRRQRLNRRIVSAALAGLSEQDLQLLLSTSGRRMARDVSFVAALGVAAVRASLATTSRTVVATATAYPLARAFLNELGLGSAKLLASHVTSNAGVVSFTHHNVAYFKARSVLAAGIRPSAVHFYTDSATDLPLAQLCSRTSLVNPSRRSRAEFDRAGLAVEVLSLNPPTGLVSGADCDLTGSFARGRG